MENDSQTRRLYRADLVTGCLVGLAVGDALGAPLEFFTREQVRNRFPTGLREMMASRLWERGEYTDDTQMALLIAESLLEKKAFIAADVARKFQRWAKTAKDVGVQTGAVVSMAHYIDDPDRCSLRYYEANPESSAGNGALMRCAPIALFYLESVEELVDASRASARVTHYDPKAQSSCVILNAWIQQAICGGVRDGRTEALSRLMDNERSSWHRLQRIESYVEKDIVSSGYTAHTLEAAAWSFLTTTSYEEAVIRAANLGNDADTVAAVCGALAGAYYGYYAIPGRWRDQLRDEPRIRKIALALVGNAKEDSTNNAVSHTMSNLDTGDSVEADFVESWDGLEVVFDWMLVHAPWRNRAFHFIAQLRQAGYDRKLRAGQSLGVFVVSRSRHHGLRPDQPRVAFGFHDDVMDVFEGNEPKIRNIDISLSALVQEVLARLVSRDID